MNKMKSNYNEIECRYNFLKWRFVTLKWRSNKLNQPFSFWTEDNRLQATHNNKIPAYYNYDASGERNLKMTGRFMNMVVNGQTMNIPVFTNQTLYASPLITLTDKGFTKHYFTEGQRICSSIGFGELTDIKDTDTPITGTLVALQQDANKSVDTTYIMCWGLSTKIKTQDLYKVATGSWDTNGLQLPPSIIPPPAPNIPSDVPFYYLTDHLGSSSYITNNIGSVTQTLAYLPFGEDWVNINNNTPYPPLTPYKFNGKEKDEETGFNYFGARLYWDFLPQFISPDPMSDKYPHLSPMAYCANNPVILKDPNGMEIDGWEVNTKTGGVRKTNEIGGNAAQYINYVDGNGNTAGSTTILGSEFNVDKASNGEYRANSGTPTATSQSVTAGTMTPIGGVVSGGSSGEGSNGVSQALTGAGVATAVGEKVMFNKSSWLGKNGKRYSTDWGGNQHTGGKLKFAKNASRFLKAGGIITAAASAIVTENQANSGQISNRERIMNHIMTGASLVPIYGTAAAVGYELGKEFGPSTWFKK